MEEANNLVEELIDAIHNTDVYTRYINAKHIVDEDISLKDKINMYKKAQLQASLDKADKQLLKETYFELIIDQRADNYLKYEKEVCDMISEIYEKIINHIDIDFDFML